MTKTGFFRFTDKPFNVSSLSKRIYTVFGRNGPREIPNSVSLSALAACKALQERAIKTTRVIPQEFEKFDDLKKTQRLIQKVVQHPKVAINSNFEVLKYYLVSAPIPESDTSIDHVIEFSQRNESEKKLTNELLHLCLRNILHEKNFMAGFQLVDAIGACRISLMETIIWTSFLAQGLTMALIDWKLLIAHYTLTLVSLSSFLFMTESTSQLRWASSVSFLDRVRRRNEIMVASRIVEAYQETAEVNAANFHFRPEGQVDTLLVDINQQLRQRGMRMVQTEEELMYQEYWKTAGKGFEWVEPDQDPADKWLK